MNQFTSIQRLSGFLILLVFILSATPKVFFHDMVADHKDGPVCILDHKTTVIHTQTFECDFDDLVVSTPFVLTIEACEGIIRDYVASKKFCFNISIPINYILNKENRGPPSV